jgi:Zn-dependent peptidase ImmA (M78 family)
MMSRAQVERLTAELLAKSNISKPPVPVEKVAEAEGFTIIREYLESDLSGFYIKQMGVPTIGINVAHAPVRQRFTIAHELGHALLHANEHYDREFRRDQMSSSAVDPDEIEANAFAASLLMPAEWIREEWAGTTDLLDDQWLVRTARQFGVSTQSLMYRLENLNLLRG